MENKLIPQAITTKKAVSEGGVHIKLGNGLTSNRTGISTTTISDWRKKNTNPGSDKIMAICAALEVTPEYLLSGVTEDSDRGMSASHCDDVFAAVKEAGVCVCDIPSSSSLADIQEDIRFIGSVVGLSDDAAVAMNPQVILTADMYIEEGNRVAILGANGCGKTTLIRAIGGILPYEGSLILDGKEVRDHKRKEIGIKRLLRDALKETSKNYFRCPIMES